MKIVAVEKAFPRTEAGDNFHFAPYPPASAKNYLDKKIVKTSQVPQLFNEHLSSIRDSPERLREYKEDFLKALPFYYPSIRVPVSVIPKLLRSGRFKNQFHSEAPSGNGYGREYKEEEHFGIPQDADPNDRPVYGYMTRTPHLIKADNYRGGGGQANMFTHGAEELGVDHLDYYGDHEIILSPHVKRYSTMSAGDSYFDPSLPHPMFDPHPENMVIPSTVHHADDIPDTHHLKRWNLHRWHPFMEHQIHTPITFPHEVAGIVFRHKFPSENLTKTLDRKGVKWAFNIGAGYSHGYKAALETDIHNLIPLIAKYHPEADREWQDMNFDMEQRQREQAKKFKWGSNKPLEELKEYTRDLMRHDPEQLVGSSIYRELLHTGFPSFLAKHEQHRMNLGE